MKPPAFDYHAPRSLPEALDLLATLENAKILAGGQSLMPMLNMRFVLPDHLIDLNRIGDLAYIRDEGDLLAIGGMTRQRDLERSPVIRARLPLMAEALRHVGHTQTRNRGTIGGSLCHLDPAAELPAVAMTLDAEIDVASARGRRTIAMRDFPSFYMTPALEPDEIATEIRFRPWQPGHGFAFEEYARRHGDFAIVAVAALLEADSGGRIARATVTVAGASAAPLRIESAERALVGAKPDEATLAAAAAPCGDIDAMEDPYASKAYRCHLARVLGERALRRAAARLGQQT